MDERQKILELVADGKLSPEQANLLLDALTQKSQTKVDGKVAWDKATAELKSIGSQMSNAFMQSLTELRRGVETNLSNISFGEHISTSLEEEFSEHIQSLFVESQNARIRVQRWSKPYARLYVQAEVRAEDQDAAHNALENAVSYTTADESASIRFVNRLEGTRIVGGRVDIYVPETFGQLAIETKNGGIFLHHVHVGALRVETVNGKIHIENVQSKTINLSTQNGGIHILSTIDAQTRDVIAQTRNGAIVVRGIDTATPLRGEAKSAAGQVQVSDVRYVVEYETDAGRKMACTFHPNDAPEPNVEAVADAAAEPVSVYLESKNGSIYIQ